MLIEASTEYLLDLHLDHEIELRHSLAVLSSHIPWQENLVSVAPLSSGKDRAGKKLSGIDLKQTFAKQVCLLRPKGGRYVYFRQFNRIGRAIELQPKNTGITSKP